ncbi:heat shock protein beta-2 isoform X2 [Phyllostomus discolor]|uniref:Heat shock protein beta-2 isoform X2 n=1 Tax=Phyllostomus discolor TaxID=89673 RepID=A0A7E6DZ27_9CHIR|nr:heat shock protein beta-2 isoform X2 [Phyllostomus discolor]
MDPKTGCLRLRRKKWCGKCANCKGLSQGSPGPLTSLRSQLTLQPGPPAVLAGPLRQLKGVLGKGRGSRQRWPNTGAWPQGPHCPPLPQPRHYFGWCRPRPHLRLSPGSAGSWRGRTAPRTRAAYSSEAMSGRSVPHAHPATAEYEFANPSRLGEQRFGEDEVTVRTVDNLLEVSARHPQRLDRHGFVSREFCRTYVLPADVDPWRVRAALSHDGILNLEAPRGGRHLDTEVNEVYISLLPAPPDPEEEEEAAGVEP